MAQGGGMHAGPTLVCSLSFSLLSSINRSRPRSSPSGPAMKADGLARKAPRRWAQVSRLGGPMVPHPGPCEEAKEGQARGRQRAREHLHAPRRGRRHPRAASQIPAAPCRAQTPAGDPAPGPRDKTERSRGRRPSGQPRVPAGQGRRRPVRAESSLRRPPAVRTETTAPPRPPAPAVTGRQLSPRLTQPPRALGPAGSFRAAARGGAGRAARGRRGRGRNGATASPPAPPAGADSPVSLGLSNCPAACGAPLPRNRLRPGQRRWSWVGPGSRMPGFRPGGGRDPRAFRQPGPAEPARMATSTSPLPHLPASGLSAPCGGRGVRVSGLPG